MAVIKTPTTFGGRVKSYSCTTHDIEVIITRAGTSRPGLVFAAGNSRLPGRQFKRPRGRDRAGVRGKCTQENKKRQASA